MEEHGRDEVDVIVDYLDLISSRILDLTDIYGSYSEWQVNNF